MSNSDNAPQQLYHPEEDIAHPHWKRFKMQGKNRYLVRVFPIADRKTREGIIVPEECQDIPTCGHVLALSPDFDHTLYPDVKPGVNIQTLMHTWVHWERFGRIYASGDAEGIVAVYDWEFDDDAYEKKVKTQTEQLREAAVRRHNEKIAELHHIAETADPNEGPTGPLIKMAQPKPVITMVSR